MRCLTKSKAITYPDNANTNAQGEGWGPLEEAAVNPCEETHFCSEYMRLKKFLQLREGDILLDIGKCF